MPQATTSNEVQAEAAVVPANENTHTVVAASVADEALAIVQSKLSALADSSLSNVMATIGSLRELVADRRQKIAASSVVAVTRASDETIEIAGAPSIWIQNKFKPEEHGLTRMGVLECSLLDKPVTIWRTDRTGIATVESSMIKIGTMKSDQKGSYGCDGLDIGIGYDYQDKLFQAWNDGSGLGKLALMPFVVVSGEVYPSDGVKAGEGLDFKNNLCKSFQDAGTVLSGSHYADWVASCTPTRYYRDFVVIAHPESRKVGWNGRDNSRFSAFACLAQG